MITITVNNRMNTMQVVITGGSGGIGFAIAGHFAAKGHNVVIADLQQSAVDDKVAHLQAQGFDAGEEHLRGVAGAGCL